MKFEQAIKRHLRVLREQEELPPEDPEAMAVDPTMDPAAVAPAPVAPVDQPEEVPDIVATKAQHLEDTRRALLMNPSDLTDDQRHSISAGEITIDNVSEKEQLIRDILSGNPGEVEIGGLEGRPGVV